jgi:hypothetical protein
MHCSRVTSQGWFRTVTLLCLPSYYFAITWAVGELYAGRQHTLPRFVFRALEMGVTAVFLSFLTLPVATGILVLARKRFAPRAYLGLWGLLVVAFLCSSIFVGIFAMWTG